MNERNAPILVAEIGCNHMGDPSIAKRMIDTAKNFCGADYVKFQKRDPRYLLSPEAFNAPHPVPHNSFGPSYGAHREYLEFDAATHAELKAYCESLGIGYACSVWELNSAREICALKPDYIKVPSASNQDYELLSYLTDEYGGKIHISLGMTRDSEEEELIAFLEGRDRLSDTVLYSCTSGYPVSFEDSCLLEIERMRKAYSGRLDAIGFSGHHLGIALDIAAFTLGAEIIERHFTLDRTWKGTDHAASLEADGLRRLARDLKAVSSAMRYKSGDRLLSIELESRNKLKRLIESRKEIHN